VATHDSGGRLVRLARTAMPRLRSGLGLQRCATTPKAPVAGPTPAKAQPEVAPVAPTTTDQEAAQPRTAEGIPRVLDKSFFEAGLTKANVEQAIHLFGQTDVANEVLAWLASRGIKAMVVFVAEGAFLPGRDRTAAGTYREVGAGRYNIYAVAGTRKGEFVLIDARGTREWRDRVVDAEPDGIADTIFHELLHVWFTNRFPGADITTGHTQSVKPTEIFLGGAKIYDEPQYDARFLAKLKQFDAQVREVKAKEGAR
ncbi:MAG: hypothetical protein M3Q23_08010, partial [Actinomycetota bacterium]|nr:hypothetical protein [Actinomycetota bacterium]